MPSSNSPRKVTPVFLDEEDGLVAEVPPTPTDGAFRRGLFVMLVALGLFLAATMFYARENRDDLVEQRRATTIAEEQVTLLTRQLSEYVERENASDIKSDRDRQQLLQRSEALERLLIALLADSDDPAVQEAFRELIETDRSMGGNDFPEVPNPEPETQRDAATDRRTRSSASPSARPQPRPSSRPSQQPSPRPSPTRSPTAQICIDSITCIEVPPIEVQP